jgi:hypothetical protein
MYFSDWIGFRYNVPVRRILSNNSADPASEQKFGTLLTDLTSA